MRDLFEADERRAEGPEPRSLNEARRVAASCTRCDLYRNATQTVFGEGPISARIMLVGEQPGDKEDIAGQALRRPRRAVSSIAPSMRRVSTARPSTSPMASSISRTSRAARSGCTERPDPAEIDICRWWLDLERKFVHPVVIVALGATALRSVTGHAATVSSLRGRPSRLPDGTMLIATIHPSYLLRMPDRSAAEIEFSHLVADLKSAVRAAEDHRAA